MKAWFASLSFWPVMTYAWSLFLMFYLAAATFGFAEVVTALAGLGDRVGLTR